MGIVKQHTKEKTSINFGDNMNHVMFQKLILDPNVGCAMDWSIEIGHFGTLPESLEEVVEKFSLIVMGRKYPYHF